MLNTPLPLHMKLSENGSPIGDKDKAYMAKVSYASAVGSLMYAMVCTRPDIANAVWVVSRYMANPGKSHWEAVKAILRYLKGTTSMDLSLAVVMIGFASWLVIVTRTTPVIGIGGNQLPDMSSHLVVRPLVGDRDCRP